MKIGLLISIAKDPKNPKQTFNNQRGITLLPVPYKLFERIILNRFILWCKSNGIIFPDPLQFAYQQQLSCIHASFTVQETINFNVENGSLVFIATLDSVKAFDVVWHMALFVKLYEMGIKGRIWRIIINAYTGMKCAVLFEGVLSRWIQVGQSVRQGGVLSAWLYLLYVNDLLVELRNSGVGARVGNIYCGSVAQADDLLLLALSARGLQRMMNIAYRYSIKWRSKYNSSKSNVSVYGESVQRNRQQSSIRKWYLGNKEVKENPTVKHVGIILSNNGSFNDAIINACTKGRGTYMSLCGAGVRPSGLNPLTSTKLYKSIVLPRALYGSELWSTITNENTLKLERMHRLCSKVTQNLATRTRSDMVSATLGLFPISAIIDRSKLLFFQGLCKMPSHYACKEVFLTKLHLHDLNTDCVSKGYIPDIMQVLEKYDLKHHVKEYIKTGYIPSRQNWKSLVDINISYYENNQYCQRTNNDPEYKLFREVMPTISASPLWRAAWEIPNSLYKF